MEYKIKEVDAEGEEVEGITFTIERRELRNLVDEIQEKLLAVDGIEKAKPIRRKKINPVIKTDRNDRVYFHWEDGDARVNLNLASEPVPGIITAHLMGESEVDERTDFPWDRGEMANKVQEMADERMRRSKEEKEKIDNERKKRAREQSNRRDDTQREPRGGGESVSGNASVVNGETIFTPPYTKEDADYKRPREKDKEHLNCKDCVHFIEGGGCHMVQGGIEEEGYCEDLYADVGLFARMYEQEFQVNLALWGEEFEDRFGNVSFKQIADRVKEAISRKL